MSSSLTTSNTSRWGRIINRVLEIVARAPGCQVAYVAGLIPDATLKEVIVTLCYLKQRGQLEVVVGKQGTVFVSLSRRLFH